MTHKSLGNFDVIDLNKVFIFPVFYKGNGFTVKFLTRERAIKITFEPLLKLKNSVKLGYWFMSVIGENMAIVYYDDDAIYISPYSKGAEYLKEVLRKLGVSFN